MCYAFYSFVYIIHYNIIICIINMHRCRLFDCLKNALKLNMIFATHSYATHMRTKAIGKQSKKAYRKIRKLIDLALSPSPCIGILHGVIYIANIKLTLLSIKTARLCIFKQHFDQISLAESYWKGQHKTIIHKTDLKWVPTGTQKRGHTRSELLAVEENNTTDFLCTKTKKY